jgi:hypothetical protein
MEIEEYEKKIKDIKDNYEKKDNRLFLIIAIIFIAIVVLTIIEADFLTGLIIIAIAFFILLFLFIELSESNDEARDILINKIEEEKKEKSIIEAQIKYNNFKKELISKYGNPNKIIKIKDNEEHYICNEIFIFEESKKIIIEGNELDFNKILDFSTKDHSTNYYDKYSNSSGGVDTGSIIGRSAVGGLIGGAPGAIIGGVTANRKMDKLDLEIRSVSYDLDRMNKYTSLYINIDDISNPKIEIRFKNNAVNEAKINEITSLLNVIINRNKNN